MLVINELWSTGDWPANQFRSESRPCHVSDGFKLWQGMEDIPRESGRKQRREMMSSGSGGGETTSRLPITPGRCVNLCSIMRVIICRLDDERSKSKNKGSRNVGPRGAARVSWRPRA